MTQSEDSLNIVKSVISLAHALRLIVVAEGVETEEQAAMLMQLGCDQMQGYLISRPIPPEDVSGLLRQRNSSAPDNSNKKISSNTKKSHGGKKSTKRR